MKHLRKVAFVLALLMALASLAGCGGKETAVESNGAKVTLNGDAIYPVQCDDTLTFWFTATAIWETKYQNFGETPLGKEVAKKSGVNIEYVHPSAGQGEEQFQILLASDELPDIVNNYWYTYPGGPDAAIKEEYIYDLSNIIDAYCPSFAKVLKENPDWEKEIKTDNGTVFAFPSIIEAQPAPVTSGTFLRADLLKKVGLDAPRNIAEWEKVLTAFKEELGIEAPYSAQKTNMTWSFGPAFGIVPGWYVDNGQVKYGQAEPAYKDFLEKMNEWYDKGLIERDFMSIDGKTLKSDFLNGVSASTVSSIGSGIGTYLEANNIEGFDILPVQFPALGDGTGKPEYGYTQTAVGIKGITTAISKNCKNVELAARFLDFGYSEAGDVVYNFGVEGDSFNWVDKDGEKYPQFTDVVFNNPEGLTVSDVLHMYTRAAHSTVPMIVDPRYTEQYYLKPQQQLALEAWSDSNMSAHILPAISLTTEETDEDSNIMAAVNTYIDEMTIKFITGREPIENFDTYIKTLKEFGIDTAIGFRQAALERYNNR